MKNQYTINIVEDTDEGTFNFSIQGGGNKPIDMESICDLLVEVAQALYEDTVAQNRSIH